MQFHPAALNQIKRDGGELSREQIRDLVSGVVDGSLGDAQLGAFLMAVCCRGMSVKETSELTLAMRDSGVVVDLSSIAGLKVDKHSTGGVGDKVSLLLAPLVAAAGVPVPMISGRGLGHTGGTIDKLHAIPGFRTDLDLEEYRQVIVDCGYVMAGASKEIAPADRRMYATRDISGTVESIALITSSILAKKLAEGIDGLVLDVKFGRAAFMKSEADATALMDSLVSTGTAAGKKVTAVLSDMDTPLGLAIGNALEVREIVDCFHARGPADLMEITLALGAEMLILADRAATPEAARSILQGHLDDGSALACFEKNIVRQGGDPAFLSDLDRLGVAPCVVEVTCPTAGIVQDIDPLAVGIASMDLGAGRRQPRDVIDPVVGVVMACKRGDRVDAGQALASIHAQDDAAAKAAAAAVAAAIVIGDDAVEAVSIVRRRVAT